jgi:hypothetical protein
MTDPTNHDCSLSPDDGCSTCEALYNAPRTQELPTKKPDYSFERKGCYADYPAGANLI